MTKEKYLIARGNPTILIENFTGQNRAAFSRDLIDRGKAEQVGFVCSGDGIPSLEMMGNELCVNAILAFAKNLGKAEGVVKASGLEGLAKYRNFNGSTCVTLKIDYKRPEEDIVILGGIGYKCVSEFPEMNTRPLKELAKKYNVPAFGYAVYTGYELRPYVYVKDTDSLTIETACGSGSIATAIFQNIYKVRQTSGGVITVDKLPDNQFTITANVVKIKEKLYEIANC